MSRVVLFEWTAGGHRPIYVRRFVEALRPHCDLLLALPQATIDTLGDLGNKTLSLGEERPPLGSRLRRRSVLAKEASLFRSAASEGDHALHLYGDHVLVRLLAEPAFPCRTSLLLYYPRAHYRTAYGTRLSPGDRAVALAKDWAVRAWRRRADAEAVFTLDEEAARRWAVYRGARAHWLPEPPVPPLPSQDRPAQREGCVLYGSLTPRKGVDLLTRALTLEPTPVRLVLAGSVENAYLPLLERQSAAMAASGVDVELRARRHSEREGLRLLAQASCALLPYPRHAGMSRVLLEAASVGTPVIAHRFGLLSHLVRAHGLGLSIDCEDPRALRSAVLTMVEPGRCDAYAEGLAAFSRRFAPARFQSALLSGLGIGQPEPSEVQACSTSSLAADPPSRP